MNDSFNRKIKILSKTIFCLCYFWMLGTLMLKKVDVIGPFLSSVYPFCLNLLFVSAVLNVLFVPKNKILIYFVVLFLAVLSKIFTGSDFIFSLGMLILASMNINTEKLIRIDIKFKFVLIVLVSILYFLGMTSVYLHYRDGVVRHSMGFSNPNLFSNYVFSVVVEYIFIRRNKLNIWDFLFALIGVVLINYFASSRTQMFCLIIFVSMLSIFKTKLGTKMHDNKVIRFILRNSFAIMFVFSLCIAVAYLNNFEPLQKMDTITAGRISSSAELFMDEEVSLFGRTGRYFNNEDSENTNSQSIALDNVYMYLLNVYGVVPSLFICMCMNKYMRYYMQKEFILAMIMFIFIIGGLMEHVCLEVPFNIFLLYFSRIIRSDSSNKMSIIENDRNINVTC